MLGKFEHVGVVEVADGSIGKVPWYDCGFHAYL